MILSTSYPLPPPLLLLYHRHHPEIARVLNVGNARWIVKMEIDSQGLPLIHETNSTTCRDTRRKGIIIAGMVDERLLMTKICRLIE